jgi:hypothetical protein
MWIRLCEVGASPRKTSSDRPKNIQFPKATLLWNVNKNMAAASNSSYNVKFDSPNLVQDQKVVGSVPD